MTSLATLAHTVPAPPPFNGLFYATAATIIPVLFLARLQRPRAASVVPISALMHPLGKIKPGCPDLFH